MWWVEFLAQHRARLPAGGLHRERFETGLAVGSTLCARTFWSSHPALRHRVSHARGTPCFCNSPSSFPVGWVHPPYFIAGWPGPNLDQSRKTWRWKKSVPSAHRVSCSICDGIARPFPFLFGCPHFPFSWMARKKTCSYLDLTCGRCRGDRISRDFWLILLLDHVEGAAPAQRSISRPTLLYASDEAISVSHQPPFDPCKVEGASWITENPGLGLPSAPTCFGVVYTLPMDQTPRYIAFQ